MKAVSAKLAFLIVVKVAIMISECKKCANKQCRLIANEVRLHINESVNPCENFYRFACGKWIESHQIPNDDSSINHFHLAHKSLKKQLIALLDGNFTFGDASDKFRKLYNECNDVDRIEERSSEPLTNALTRLGGWPVVDGDNWNSGRFDWLRTLYEIRRSGYDHNIVLSVSVDPDVKNNSMNVVNLDQTSLALPDKKYYSQGFDNEAYSAYYSLMVKCAEKLGADSDRARREMRDVINLETQLADIMVPDEELRDQNKLVNYVTISALVKKYSNIRFVELLAGILNAKFSGDEEVNIVVPKFLDALNKLLPNLGKRKIANYLLWRVILSSLEHLSSDWKKLGFEFQQALTGQKEEKSRPLFCAGRATDNLYIASAALFIQNNPEKNKKIKEKSQKLVEELLKTVELQMKTNKWMQQETIERAILKLKSMLTIVAYPLQYEDTSLINQYFSTLELNGKYYEDYFLTNTFSVDIQMKRFRQQNTRDDWRRVSDVLQVNAYNDINNNLIVIFLGILRGFIFNENRSICRNLASIGSIIGHEIYHALDDEGKQFNELGNLENWWDKKTSDAYATRQQCVINQYNKYYVPEVDEHVNGINTQGENIADIGGSKTAFKTYQRLKKQCESCPKCCVKYTSDQLFWIRYAMSWCEKSTKESLLDSVLSDPHSPAEFRVNGPLSNHPEFARSFRCPVGSPMNPKEKCSFW